MRGSLWAGPPWRAGIAHRAKREAWKTVILDSGFRMPAESRRKKGKDRGFLLSAKAKKLLGEDENSGDVYGRELSIVSPDYTNLNSF